MRSLVSGRFHYIAGPAGREQLYDIVSDPFGSGPIIAMAAVSDSQASLRTAMSAFPMADRHGR